MKHVPPDDTSLADALIQLSKIVQQVFAEVSRERGLTSQQAHLLCLLIHGPVSMTELGRMLFLEKSSLTGLVDRVQMQGLVGRTHDERDRRVYNVELTAQGIALAMESHALVTERLERLVGGLSTAERRRLVSHFTHIASGHSELGRPETGSRAERHGQLPIRRAKPRPAAARVRTARP